MISDGPRAGATFTIDMSSVTHADHIIMLTL